ncbi:MAG TPA: hypothetical protein PKA49_07715, partial [Tepidiformaceae bacterium]|nr:hypothetical protein [Tepidiformaceae bacterium]
LTALADVLPRVWNAHVAVRDDGGEVVFEHRIVPGPSDRSYGIHVARLAGLPGAVVTRAEHLLAEFEAARDGLPRGGGSAPPQAAVAFQPSFFAGPSPIEEAVRRLDPDGMTPIEAIQALYELRALMGKAKGTP